MKSHPEIRWSRVARSAITRYLEMVELLEKATDPKLTEEESIELGLRIQHATRRRGAWRSLPSG
jgi:hypothetical protein